VEGNVINSVTGNGIPGMQVEIRPAGVRTGYSTTTAAQGHFVIEGIPAGTYTASFSSPDYVLSGEPSVFPVTAGGTPAKLEVRMVPLARISGRVVDGRGDGVANARLELIGARLLDESTDATGKFEFRLLPGGYTLSVVPPIGLKPPSREPDNDRVMVWTRTFYPGVSLPEAASKIVAQFGRVISGIELRLQSVPVHAVRGVLLNPDGTPAPKLAITLSEEIGQPAHRAESGSGGAFEFPAVVDGKLAPCGRAGEQRPETAGYAVDRNGGSRTGRCEASSQPAIHGARPSGDGNAQRRASAEHALGFSSRPCGQHRQGGLDGELDAAA
jgi:hypothetical protein